VSAEQVADVRVGDARAVDVDLTDGEIVQLVLDLRNHLTVMTLYVDAIRDGLAHCPADRLSELQRSAELAVRLIDALLVDGRQPQALARTLADLNEAVRRTAATLSHDEDNPIGVRPSGGVVTIKTAIAHAGPAAIEEMRPGPYARMIVTDTGCGMTAAVKDRIFHGFFTTKPNGTGLGLRSVALTIRQLQGRISVESEPWRGTSVTVLLPLAAGDVLNVSAPGCPLD
jgi:two-component system cell cycle sensor histidine kinase/response regulator CckA